MFKKAKIATLFLIGATFFLPFGFDAILATAIKLTNGYWNAILLLYCLVALFATLYFFFRKNSFLILALFVNPLGYDFLFAWTMKITGSFLYADMVFYGISFIFYGIYFYLVKLHPIKYTLSIFENARLKIQNLF